MGSCSASGGTANNNKGEQSMRETGGMIYFDCLARNCALLFALVVALGFLLSAPVILADPNRQSAPTALQQEIEKQTERLRSPEVEERRDAVMRLAVMRRPEAARATLPALRDPAPIVRATATGALLSLPGEESAASLIPLLTDLDEFVRREAVYALGHTRSRSAVPPLIERLNSDRSDQVRAAAVVGLGEIGDESAVVVLAQILAPTSSTPATQKKRKSKENEFVLRATARALGQIRSRSGVPALVRSLADDSFSQDVKREATRALGLIGDQSAVPALRAAMTSNDPYLSQIANEAVRKLSAAANP